LRSITIIAVTSYALSGEEQKARAAGCDDYVPKTLQSTSPAG
jgi:two-component system cell cycle response regulator DivK